MALRIIAFIETAASVIVLIYSLRPAGEPLSAQQGTLVGLVTAGFVVMAVMEYQRYRKDRPLAFRTEREINNYMVEWISKGSRVVIFTRDMSWANETRIIQLLSRKAQRNELSICLPEEIELTRQLEGLGANIISYEYLDYVPQSRFTIINKDRMDAHVAVGRRIENKHIVEEYHVGEHYVFAVANDLIEILKRVKSIREANNG